MTLIHSADIDTGRVKFFSRAVYPMLCVVCAAWLLTTQSVYAADLRLFTARYQVRFHGLSGGTLEFTLRKGEKPNEYIYESRAKPSFLGSFWISDVATESSTMLIEQNEIRPEKFLSDDGKSGDEKDSNVTFDWDKNLLTGRSERVDFNQPLPPRIQDHLSIQVAVIYALQNDLKLGDYSLIDAGEIKRYLYSIEGGKDDAEKIIYKGRTLKTVIVRSERSDTHSDRVMRYWHASELNFVPVRAERSRNGKVDLTMTLVDLKWQS